ncbi:MAG: ABC transporter ATP-binding protein [Alphaproteobacteria bacterium]|nr:ABC transporter ATP-binding protein [Alphaproteobacteria bacterium]PPR14176.1 MAG: Maltose/maltodextrin import ATP-binding protein MalK [Alphaproteobacteria bacterium MarineAlpha12_Bin1]
MYKIKSISISPHLLELRNVCLTRNKLQLFSKLNIKVSAGEVVTIMGPSGCGKSSLLAYICGTLSDAFQASGEVFLNGSSLEGMAPEFRQVGILFQDDMLFPHMSVGQNLLFGLTPHVKGKNERTKRINQALDESGLPGLANRMPETLSGGQRSRVALMRTLLSEPKALLLDEPFSSLDSDLRDQFREFVFSHLQKYKIPTLLVTHDHIDAEAAGGPVIKLI